MSDVRVGHHNNSTPPELSMTHSPKIRTYNLFHCLLFNVLSSLHEMPVPHASLYPSPLLSPSPTQVPCCGTCTHGGGGGGVETGFPSYLLFLPTLSSRLSFPLLVSPFHNQACVCMCVQAQDSSPLNTVVSGRTRVTRLGTGGLVVPIPSYRPTSE